MSYKDETNANPLGWILLIVSLGISIFCINKVKTLRNEIDDLEEHIAHLESEVDELKSNENQVDSNK